MTAEGKTSSLSVVVNSVSARRAEVAALVCWGFATRVGAVVVEAEVGLRDHASDGCVRIFTISRLQRRRMLSASGTRKSTRYPGPSGQGRGAGEADRPAGFEGRPVRVCPPRSSAGVGDAEAAGWCVWLSTVH